MRQVFSAWWAVLALACILNCAWARAQAAELKDIPLSYPGLLVQGEERALFHVEAYMVKLGAQVYCATYGEWPREWSDVVAAGIVTAPLLTPFGEVINPDDRRFDFDYDLHYDHHNGTPRTALYIVGSNPGITYQPIENTPPLIPSNMGMRHPELVSKVQEPGRQQQLAVNRMLGAMLSLFAVTHRRAPQSWAEFAASGYCPLAADTLNPLTGEPYRFDGSANNFRYDFLPEAGEHGGYYFKPTDESGESYWPYSN